MPEADHSQLPFRVGFDMESGEIIVWMAFGAGSKKTTRRKIIGSLEEVAVTVAEHRHEAFLQQGLADQLARAAVTYLGADPGRLETAVRSLSDPTSSVSVSQILRGTPPPQPAG